MRRSKAFRNLNESLASCGEFLLFVALAPVAILASLFGEGHDNIRNSAARRTAVHPDSRT